MARLIIRYMIAGEEYYAGPYNTEEAVDQAQDIAGYEGVTNVWADDAQHPTMPLRSELAARLKQQLEALQLVGVPSQASRHVSG